MKNKNFIEILAPVGSWPSFYAALSAEADAVYFSSGTFNMRARSATNFSFSDLEKIVKIAKEKKVKTYVTVNTILYDNDLSLMKKTCDAIKNSGANAVIATDIATILYAKSISLPIHASTQLNISNIEAVQFYSQYVETIVLARELTLEQISSICSEILKKKILSPLGSPIKIELFVHGSLCVSIAGKCYMSLAEFNTSANRGKCFQPCRKKYKVFDEETGNSLIIDNEYVMSPKDLCTISFMDKIIHSGVSLLKIEGRGRSPEYVYTTVKTYKQALQAVLSNTFSKEKVSLWLEDLKKVYNRGFWEGGYYLGKKLGQWSASYGSQATRKKSYIGKAKNYFSHKKIAEFLLEAGEIKKGNSILIIGKTTGIIDTKIEQIRDVNGKEITHAKKGEIITFPIDKPMKKNDQLYILYDKT